jgi:hypothetical protein
MYTPVELTKLAANKVLETLCRHPQKPSSDGIQKLDVPDDIRNIVFKQWKLYILLQKP